MSDRQSVPSGPEKLPASPREPRRDRARRVAELLGVTLLVAPPPVQQPSAHPK